MAFFDEPFKLNSESDEGLEKSTELNLGQLSIAMLVVKGNHNLSEKKLRKDLALFLGGVIMGGNPEKTCKEVICAAHGCDPQRTEELAETIGLNLRECGVSKI